MDEKKSIFYWIRKDVMRAEHISTYLSKIINDLVKRGMQDLARSLKSEKDRLDAIFKDIISEDFRRMESEQD